MKNNCESIKNLMLHMLQEGNVPFSFGNNGHRNSSLRHMLLTGETKLSNSNIPSYISILTSNNTHKDEYWNQLGKWTNIFDIQNNSQSFIPIGRPATCLFSEPGTSRLKWWSTIEDLISKPEEAHQFFKYNYKVVVNFSDAISSNVIHFNPIKLNNAIELGNLNLHGLSFWELFGQSEMSYTINPNNPMGHLFGALAPAILFLIKHHYSQEEGIYLLLEHKHIFFQICYDASDYMDEKSDSINTLLCNINDQLISRNPYSKEDNLKLTKALIDAADMKNIVTNNVKAIYENGGNSFHKKIDPNLKLFAKLSGIKT